MASYYYLISSLPMLKSDGSIPIDSQSFLQQCKSCVSDSMYYALCNLSDTNNSHPMLKSWAKFYNSLMDELNYQRKIKLGKSCAVPENRDAEVVNTIASALAAKNPLISEQMLLELEFNRIDSMMGLHSFDEYYLYGYAIKLKLLERQTIFKHDDGNEEFRTLFTELKNQILSM